MKEAGGGPGGEPPPLALPEPAEEGLAPGTTALLGTRPREDHRGAGPPPGLRTHWSPLSGGRDSGSTL